MKTTDRSGANSKGSRRTLSRIISLAFMSTLLLACAAKVVTPTRVAPVPRVTCALPPVHEVYEKATLWASLADRDVLWRSADADSSCGPARASYYMPKLEKDLSVEAEVALRLGCNPVPAGSTNEKSGVLPKPGLSEAHFCCPTSLGDPPKPSTAGGKSCEQATYEYTSRAMNATPGPTDDVPARHYGDVLGKGEYLNGCNVQASTDVSICAAVLAGRVVGVTVRLNPFEAQQSECIAKAVSRLEFEPNAKLAVTRTQFARIAN